MITIASQNPAKIKAVELAWQNFFGSFDIVIKCQNVDSKVADQPKTLEETFTGARNRALAAWLQGTLAIGIEDGLYPNPLKDGHYFNISICCIWDGQQEYFGTSSSFAYPVGLTDTVFDEGLDISKALNKLGFTDDPQVGKQGGAIGILSNGKLKRPEYASQAVFSAIINWQSETRL